MLFIILLILQTSFHQSCLIIIITIFIRTNSTWFGKRLFLVWEDKQSFVMHKIYETLFSLTCRIVRFYTGHFRVLIPEKYESRIQLKESGIPQLLKYGIQIPLARNPKSKIFWYGLRNSVPWPESGFPTVWNPESKTILKVPYIGGEKKWHSLIVESSPRFSCCIWHWFNLDFSSKRGDTSCFLWGPYCLSVLCPDLPLTYGEKCCRRSGYEINLPLSKAASARKTENTRAVHALSKYVGTCGQKRERGL